LTNWDKIEFIFAYKLRIAPDSLDSLPFYRLENLLKNYQEHMDKENEQQSNQQREYEKQHGSPQQMMKQSQPQMPKMDMGSFKMPSMPNLNMPKL